MKKSYLLTGLILFAASSGFAQMKIGAAGAPDPSAMLEITSGTSGNKGLLLPKMTTAQRNGITNPATGLMVYNTTTNQVQVNTGTPATPIWVAAIIATTAWSITGNAGTSPLTNFFGTTDNQPLVFRTNNTEKVRVTETGYLGIGTSLPVANLHIADTGDVAIRLGSTTLGRSSVNLGQGNNWHGITRNLTNSGGGYNDVALYTSTGGGVPGAIYLSANPTGTDVVSLTQFALKNTGNIGMGTSDPATKLHIDSGALRISNGSTALTNAAIEVINDGGGGGKNDNIVIKSYGASGQPSIGTFTSRGTFNSPSNSLAGDNLGNFYFSARVNGVESPEAQIGARYLGNGTTHKSRMSFSTSGEIAMMIDSSTNVGIGIASPKVKLQLNGGLLIGRDTTNPSHGNGSFFTWNTIRFGGGETEFINYRGTGGGGFRFYDVDPGGSTVTAAPSNWIAYITPGTGAYATPSDARVKTNVNTINDGLEKVMAMNPVSYDFHTNRKLRNGTVTFASNDQTIKSIGFLAQELAKVVPEAVLAPRDPANELYSVSYATLVPVLTKAIQELNAKIDSLVAENAQLRANASTVADLTNRLKQLEQLVLANTTTTGAQTALK